LYESAILGVPVIAVGDHPIRINRMDKLDRLLAGALFLNIDRADGDLKRVLDRFNLEPLI
jgi:hypothetical protein